MEYLTVQEVSEQTGLTPQTLRGMLRDGALEGYESGGRWVIPAHAVDALAEHVEAVEEALESGENEPVEDDDLEGDEEEDEEEDEA